MSDKYEFSGRGMTMEQAEAFGDWLNRWAGADDHDGENRDYRAGYEQAVQDIIARFTQDTDWGYKRVREPRARKSAPEVTP